MSPVLDMRGPCAKREVRCVILGRDEKRYVGTNDCANPQTTCPRAPGEGYDKCKSICNQAGHAEIEALKVAGSASKGAKAFLFGHYWMCEPCGRALAQAGVHSVQIEFAP